MKGFFRILSLILFLLFLFSSSITSSFVMAHTSKPTNTTKNILFLNSYHSGYKWSDDIYDGIRSVLNSGPDKIKLQVEYMDTQRGIDDKYLKLLLDTYQYKFRDKYFDLIISSDDAAFEFLIKHSNELFPETPVVFCGVNYFEQSTIDNHKQFTGVIEGFDISSTIDTAIKFHPNIQKVYYIVDDTTTGNSIMKEFSKSMSSYSSNLDFIQLYGENLDEIINKVSFLSKNSIILYLIHFRDNQNNYYEYYEAISMIEQNSSVPIYGVWNFNLGHGIVGGKLTSGFYQGKTAAKIALRILAGEHPNNIPVLTEETTHYEFDFNQLVKHNIPLELLPQDSKIINKSSHLKKQVLILHSYNKGLKWTDDLELGIKSKLTEGNFNLEFTYEYMDSQRNSDPVYLHHLYELLIRKYKDKQFDLVITTDDIAFNFIKTHHDNVFKGIPSIFCGVNYFEESMLEEQDFLTGVVESYDLRGTIDIALEINPKIKNIIVINDTTITGQSNQKNLDIIIPEYSDRVSFKIWNNLTMAEIQEGVKTLNTDDIILLLSLNRDKSNNSFSYDESISLISENAMVPIYGVWDFYLGKGLLGGVLTSGITHGETVGNMAIEILHGKYPSEILVVTESPNIYMFDYFILKKFNINLDKLPIGSTIINKPRTIFDYYQDNKKVLLSTASIFLVLCIILLLIYLKASHNKERYYALTDLLTGIPNRRAAIEHLEKLIKKSQYGKFKTTICFIDVNNLKIVNDTFGHREGDNLLSSLCMLIKPKLRSVDMLCRFAGDEFLIIFSDIGIEESKCILNEITKCITEYNHSNNNAYEISFSYGFSEYNPDEYISIDELIDKADNAMYQSKVKSRQLNN